MEADPENLDPSSLDPTNRDLAGEAAPPRERRSGQPVSWRFLLARLVLLAGVMGLLPVHFSDGYLTRAQHEMIASYVSVLNRCHF